MTPMLWIYAGVGVLVLALSGAVTLQTSRLNTCQAEAETAKVLIQSLGDKIGEQNAAVEALDAAGKLAKVKGAKAVAAARQQALDMASEVNRLTGLLKQQPGAARACSDGVRDAREGLVP